MCWWCFSGLISNRACTKANHYHRHESERVRRTSRLNDNEIVNGSKLKMDMKISSTTIVAHSFALVSRQPHCDLIYARLISDYYFHVFRTPFADRRTRKKDLIGKLKILFFFILYFILLCAINPSIQPFHVILLSQQRNSPVLPINPSFISFSNFPLFLCTNCADVGSTEQKRK